MKLRIWLACSALLTVVAWSPPALAASTDRGCSVSPNPVVQHQPWSISAWGMTPNATYWLKINQVNDPSNNSHPNWSLDTGSDGSGTVSFTDTDISPDFTLSPDYGAGSVQVYPFDEIAKGTVKCKFTVVAG